MRDPYGRTLDYVRISITDRCNFRCLYCMPANGIAWNPHEDIMTYEDIFFLVHFSNLSKELCFTGGDLRQKGSVLFRKKSGKDSSMTSR